MTNSINFEKTIKIILQRKTLYKTNLKFFRVFYVVYLEFISLNKGICL